jgi:hypothetical protein
MGLHQDGLYGQATSSLDNRNDLQYLGGKVTRGEVAWSVHEPSQGNFSWGNMDTYVSNMAAAGILIVAFIEWPPQWASGSTDFAFVPWAPPNTQATWDTFCNNYATFCGAVAARYDTQLVYEIWNEPNERFFWHPDPDAGGLASLAMDRYGQLFTTAKAAILQAAPTAKVGLGGITGLTAGGDILGVNYISGLMQRSIQFDYAGIHAYTVDGGTPGPGSFYDAPISVYNLLQGNSAYQHVKLWMTELGRWSSDAAGSCSWCVGPTTQADYVELAMQRVDQGWEGRVPTGVITIWNYFLGRDQPDFSGAGLFTSGGTAKASANRFRDYLIANPR